MLFNPSEIPSLPDFDDALSKVDVPSGSLDFSLVATKDDFLHKKQKAWRHNEPRCDFKYDPQLSRCGLFVMSVWRRSILGRTLSEIKADPAEVDRFGKFVSEFILEFLGNGFNPQQWAIITAPCRRHKENNFAKRCARDIANRLNISFLEDIFTCHSRQRVNAVFNLEYVPQQDNLIVFDDIVTTGSTLIAMNKLIKPLGKNTFFVTGIKNR